jgi:hypothetical protein
VGVDPKVATVISPVFVPELDPEKLLAPMVLEKVFAPPRVCVPAVMSPGFDASAG